MGKLAGKVALITGGNSGMGRDTAALFAAEGASVVLFGRDQKTLDSAAEQIGHGAVAIKGDVSNLDDLDRLYGQIAKKFGRLDILFANAGIGEMMPADAITEAHYDRLFSVNVKGLVFTVVKALPLLSDGGSILLNASVAAVKGMEAFSVYSATKAAVRSFARSWTNDLKARGIRVNSISPGPIQTPIFDRIGLSEEQKNEFGHAVTQLVPMGRMGRGDEIAKAALFLVSDDASYITGVDLQVDGGMAQI